ncbi:hypothetical protein [Alkalihalobacillus sp. BA299]|uniref:hypothetical protein n=1 Tax=Alkalihalobacillus sp. BA299 TaxID=2815938 RepID=UPI001ADCDF2F|nr:hypothetical protein [Alkalihalobacillus sp. BA299]
MNKKLIGFMMAGALTIGAGNIAIPAFASETDSEVESSSTQEEKTLFFGHLDEETMEKVKEIREQVKAGTLTEEEAKAELEELGITHPMKGMRGMRGFGHLDEETMEKVKEIREQVKAGTLTEEEAKAELEELGITLPMKGMRGMRGFGHHLDEETMEKVKEIREQVKAGTLTEEEAKAQLEELGISKPKQVTTENNNTL